MRLSEALTTKYQEGRTIREMADELDVSPGSVENWLKGWRSPQLHHIPRLADYLDCTIGDVVLYALEDARSANSAMGGYLSPFSFAAA